MMVILTAIGYYRKVAVPSFLAEQHRKLEAMAQRRQLQANSLVQQSEQAQSPPSDQMRLAA